MRLTLALLLILVQLGASAQYRARPDNATTLNNLSARYYQDIYYHDSAMFVEKYGSTTGISLYVGYHAGNTIATGANVMVGNKGMRHLDNDSAYRNTGVGYGPFWNTTTGCDNSFFGDGAGQLNTTGSGNSAFGQGANGYNKTASFIQAFGQEALSLHVSGNENDAFGYQAMAKNESGAQNVSIGSFSLWENVSGSNNIAIGYGAGSTELGSNKLYIGAGDSTACFIFGNNATHKLWLNTKTITKSVEATDSTQCLIMVSPDGSRWKLRIRNDGTINTTKL